MTVEQGEVECRVGTANGDRRVFAEPARGGRSGDDIDACQAAERIGNVLVGELADILRGDDLRHHIIVALGVQRRLDRRADAGDDDVARLLRSPGAHLSRTDRPLDLIGRNLRLGLVIGRGRRVLRNGRSRNSKRERADRACKDRIAVLK